VAPIDGKEYAARRGPKPQHTQSQVMKRDRLAARDDLSVKRTTGSAAKSGHASCGSGPEMNAPTWSAK